MSLSVFIFVFLSIILIHAVESDNPVIKIPSLGELKGNYFRSRGGKTYSAFLGIPYAEKPMRFEPSKPVKSWEGLKNATGFGSHCLQGNLGGPPSQSGSEDCLYLNIFTHNVNANFSVMVNFHSGGFMFGSANMQGGEFYMDEEVVLVTLNYRLGALGFLSTGDGVIAGNFGLKYQNLALQWVQEHIQYFGGDKGNVTLFGVSAGGSSVLYHILSPKSKGLFHRGISQSGSALNPWAYVIYPREAAIAFAMKIGCPTDDTQQMANCLKGKTDAEIMEAQNYLVIWKLDPLAPFAPTKEVPSENAFLAEDPITLLKEGRFTKVPWIVTIVKEEGRCLSVAYKDKLRTELNDQWEKLAPLTFQYDDIGLSKNRQNSISVKIKEFYFDGKPIEKSLESDQRISNVYGDRWFIHGIQKGALLYAKHGSPVYAGMFGFPGLPSSLTFFGLPAQAEIVAHADDTKFHHDWSAIMGVDDRPQDAKHAQEKASRMIVKLWVQFASGSFSELKVSGVTWPKVSSDEVKKDSLNWLLLEAKPKILIGIFDKRMKFWDDALKKFKNST